MLDSRPPILDSRFSILDVHSPRHPEGKYGADAVGLGFEGVGVESRGVVLDVKVVEPVEIAQHEAGAKAAGVPVFEVAVDLCGAATESLAGPEEFAVMVEVVDTDFEAVLDQCVTELTGGDVFLTFGDQVERGAKSEYLFQLHELLAFGQADGTFNIMGKNDGEFLALRPTGPAIGCFASGRVDGPNVLMLSQFPTGRDPTHYHTQAPR